LCVLVQGHSMTFWNHTHDAQRRRSEMWKWKERRWNTILLSLRSGLFFARPSSCSGVFPAVPGTLRARVEHRSGNA